MVFGHEWFSFRLLGSANLATSEYEMYPTYKTLMTHHVSLQISFPLSHLRKQWPRKTHGIPQKVEVQETQTVMGGSPVMVCQCSYPFLGIIPFCCCWPHWALVKLIPSKDFEHLTFKADIAKVDQGRWIIAAPPQHCSGKRWGKICSNLVCVHTFWVYGCPKAC